MVRSDEFFSLILELEGDFSDRCADANYSRKYGINQSTLNRFNLKHNLPMERIESLDKIKAEDVFLEFFYLPIKSVSNPEMHFNLIDQYYTVGASVYNNSFKEMTEFLSKNYTVDRLYEWRLKAPTFNNELLIERIEKIKSYFRQR